MSEIKHTPGEWYVSDDEHGDIASDEYHFITAGAGLCSPPDYVGFEIAGCMSLADARLIAAAPRLLEALRDLIGWVPGPEHWHTDACPKAVDRAVAAIAKAIGSQS